MTGFLLLATLRAGLSGEIAVISNLVWHKLVLIINEL
jgi:hypothetical protein